MAEFVADVRGFADKAGETPLPSYKAIRARMLDLDPAFVAGKRYGAGAKRKVSLVTGSHPDVTAPWDVVQIDQTPCDVMVVDEVHRKPIGRPTLSVAIDLYSRCIVGFAVTPGEASGITVALCLAHAVLDKTEWLAQRRLDLSYPVW
jgi:putative transposase